MSRAPVFVVPAGMPATTAVHLAESRLLQACFACRRRGRMRVATWRLRAHAPGERVAEMFVCGACKARARRTFQTLTLAFKRLRRRAG